MFDFHFSDSSNVFTSSPFTSTFVEYRCDNVLVEEEHFNGLTLDGENAETDEISDSENASFENFMIIDL